MRSAQEACSEAMSMRRADAAGIQAAAEHMLDGGIVVFPTETYYGLAADPRHAGAVNELIKLKRRRSGHPLPLLAGELAQVTAFVPAWREHAAARRLAEALWPGPLTLVLAGGVRLAPGVAGLGGTLAMRWSAHPVAAALARGVGCAIIATSANRSSEPPQHEANGAWQALGAGSQLLVLDGGASPGGAPSTLVRVAGEVVEILREGVLTRGRVMAALTGDDAVPSR